jgi:hypothetical protein
MFLAFLISFVQAVFIGLIDAVIKGNVIAHYNSNWSLVPWYFKQQYIIYPLFIALIYFSLGAYIAKKLNFGWKYIFLLFIWALSGVEDISYWLWISVLNINQVLSWLPDTSFFWWYPKTAPWLNSFLHLKLISGTKTVTREAVFWGTAAGSFINLVFSLIWQRKRDRNLPT